MFVLTQSDDRIKIAHMTVFVGSAVTYRDRHRWWTLLHVADYRVKSDFEVELPIAHTK